MKIFWRYLKQQSWLMALPLLFMAAYGNTVFAATTPSFSATASGSTNNLTLTANINVGDDDVGKSGNNYLGFNYQQLWYFHNGTTWTTFDGGALPVYSALPLFSRSIEVVRDADLSSLIGAQLYVGYGVSESDMLAKGKYGMVYTVTDTSTPTVTGTLNASGAINVATNTKIGVAFSEAMNPSTITSANFTLKETVSGAAVAGTVSYTGVNAIFIPSGNLSGNTGYTVTVKGGAGGAKDLAGNPLASDFTIAWTTGVGADITAPTATASFPANGATNIAANTNIGIVFSEVMNPLTITNTSITLKETATGKAIAGTVSYSGVTAVFIPSSALVAYSNYTVTVKGGASGVKDLTDNVLASDFVVAWSTGAVTDAIAPTVTGTLHTNGAVNVAVNTKPGISFSEFMNPLTITNLNFTVKETVSGTAVAGIVSYAGVTAAFVPLNNLAANTSYTVTVKGGASGVKDLAGNAMAGDFAISWITGAVADTLAPTVIGTTNANGASDVFINTSVGATLSEWLDPTTVTNANFTLKNAAGSPIAGTVSYSGVNAVFVPLNFLSYNTNYTATLKGGASGVKDLTGNPMVSDFTWNWTTLAGQTSNGGTDTTAPTVTLANPANLATGVSINGGIMATFSEAMDPLMITTATFTLQASGPPLGATIAGLVTYDALTKIATFKPSSNLANGTTYTATITTGAKDLAGNALAVNYVWSFTTGAQAGPAAVNLGTAGNFAILAKTAVSTVPASVITGDVGVSPAATTFLTGFSLTMVGTTSATSTQVTGNLYGADMTAPTSSNLTTAVSNMEAAFTDAAGRAIPDFLNLGVGEIGGQTLVPGLYKWTTGVTISTNVTISGGPNDVWIFQIPGNLTMTAAKNVTLLGGAKAKNIFWQVAGAVEIGTTAHFEGIILSQTSITLRTGASMNGRALAQTAVVLETSTVTNPTP